MRTLLLLVATTLISSLAACTTHVSGATGGGGSGGSGGSGGTPSSDGGAPDSDGGHPSFGGGPIGGGDVGGFGDAHPPPAGPPRAGDGPGAVFAISKLFLGDTDRNGVHDVPNGWKNFGYDVDGQITQCTGNACNQVHDHCKPAAGASKALAYPDGAAGIDNSFGANILPVLLGIQSNYSTQVNAGIAAGKWTVLFDVEALGAQSEYEPLRSLLYTGDDLGHPPAFDGSDAWPVRPESLNDPSDVTSAKTVFPKSYVVYNTWVSGFAGQIEVPLDAGGFELTLEIGAAIASFEMPASHDSATNGTISGVLDTEQFVTAFRKLAGQFNQSLCSGNTIDSVVNQIRQASDIMKDGSPGNQSETCDGISIGLGFNARPVQLGGIGAPTSTSDPCGP